MRIGIRIPPCASVGEVVDCIVCAEEAGLDSVWIPDTPLLARELHVVMAAAAARTSRIRLAAAVTNFETRDMSVLASAWQALAEVAGDRVLCGFGVGGSAVYLTGHRRTPHGEFREQLEGFRALQRGGNFRSGSSEIALREASQSIPIHVAAGGPRNLRLAGELADGVILATGMSPALIEESVAMVREGAVESGRSWDDMEVVATGYGSIGDNDVGAARLMKPVCLHFAQTGQHHILERAGIDLRDIDLESIRAVYPDLLHAEDWEAAMQAAEIVDDSMAQRFADEYCLFGTPRAVVEKIQKAEAAGASTICFRHHDTYALPYELIGAIAEQVMPLLDAHNGT